MGVSQFGVVARSEPSAGPGPGVGGGAISPTLVALCAIARFHQVAADPHHLAHKTVNTGSGYQAKVFVNELSNEIYIANAGTNDFEEVR